MAYGIEWNADVIIMDMELVLQNTLKKLPPTSSLRSCYFHYVKALWSHAVSYGVKKRTIIKKQDY